MVGLCHRNMSVNAFCQMVLHPIQLAVLSDHCTAEIASRVEPELAVCEYAPDAERVLVPFLDKFPLRPERIYDRAVGKRDASVSAYVANGKPFSSAAQRHNLISGSDPEFLHLQTVSGLEMSVQTLNEIFKSVDSRLKQLRSVKHSTNTVYRLPEMQELRSLGKTAKVIVPPAAIELFRVPLHGSHVVAVEMRYEHVIHIVAVWIHALDVPCCPLSCMSLFVRQYRQCQFPTLGGRETSAVDHRRSPVRENQEHAFSGTRIEEMDLKMAFLPALPRGSIRSPAPTARKTCCRKRRHPEKITACGHSFLPLIPILHNYCIL